MHIETGKRRYRCLLHYSYNSYPCIKDAMIKISMCIKIGLQEAKRLYVMYAPTSPQKIFDALMNTIHI